MSLALYAATAYEIISKDKKAVFPISVDLAIHCTLIILGYSLMVGFDSPFGNQVSGSGYGYYSMNLLAPFLHFPQMGPEIMNPFATAGQREGYNYLGLGVILVLAYVLARRRAQWREQIRNNKALFTLLVLLTLFALSNVVYASDIFILEYNLPNFAEKLFNVFRSSGRFFWPVHYVLLIYAIATLDRIRFRKHYLMVLTYGLFALVQFADLHMLYALTHDAVARGNRNIEQTALWKDVLTGQEALFLLPTINMGMMGSRGFDYKLINIAANRGLPVNSFNLARSSGPESEEAFMKAYLAKLPNRGRLFAFAKDSHLVFLKTHRVKTRNVFLAGEEDKTFLYSEHWPETVRNQYQDHFLALNRIKTIETTSMGGSPGKASILIDGYEYSLNNLGINILIIDNLVQTYSLDTHRDPEASEELANLLQKTTDGALIVLGVNDEAAMHLTDKAKKAMQLLGAKEFTSITYRDSYIFSCIKGKRTLFEQRSSSPIQFAYTM